MGTVNRKFIIRLIAIYMLTMVLIFVTNMIYIKVIKLYPLWFESIILMVSIGVWFVFITGIYILSYIVVNRAIGEQMNSYYYFLPYFTINMILGILLYTCFRMRFGVMVVYYIEIWFCVTNIIAWLFSDGLMTILYQTVIYNLWIMLIAYVIKYFLRLRLRRSGREK